MAWCMRFSAAIALVLLMAGCGTKSLRVSSFDSQHQAGVVYCLPKTLLRVKVTYTVVSRKVLVNGVTKAESIEVQVVKPVVVEAVVVADDMNRLVIDGTELSDSVWLAGNTKLTVGSNLLLAGVEADTLDKGPEVVESAVSSALSIAKMIVAAGQFDGEPIVSIRSRLDAINRQIATEVSGIEPVASDGQTAEARAKRLARIEELLAERRRLIEIAQEYEKASAETIESRDVDYVITLDPSDPDVFKSDADGKSLSCDLNPPRIAFGSSSPAPAVVTVTVYKSADEQVIAASRVPAKDVAGVIYRPAVPVRVSVDINESRVLDEHLPMAQFGDTAIAPARYKPWAKLKTVAKMDPSSGGLVEYGTEFTSSAERAAKVIESSVSKLSTMLGEVQKARVDAEKAAAGQPAADLETQTKLLKAQLELDKARIDLEKFRRDNGIE